MASQVGFRILRRRTVMHRFEIYTSTRIRPWGSLVRRRSLMATTKLFSEPLGPRMFSGLSEEDDLARHSGYFKNNTDGDNLDGLPRVFDTASAGEPGVVASDSPGSEKSEASGMPATPTMTPREILLEELRKSVSKSTSEITKQRPQLKEKWQRRLKRRESRRRQRQRLRVETEADFGSWTAPTTTTTLSDPGSFQIDPVSAFVPDDRSDIGASSKNSLASEDVRGIDNGEKSQDRLDDINMESLFLSDLLDEPIEENAVDSSRQDGPKAFDSTDVAPVSLMDLLESDDKNESDDPSWTELPDSMVRSGKDRENSVTSHENATAIDSEDEASTSLVDLLDLGENDAGFRSTNDAFSTIPSAEMAIMEPTMGGLQGEDAQEPVPNEWSMPLLPDSFKNENLFEETTVVDEIDSHYGQSFVDRGVMLLDLMEDTDWAALDEASQPNSENQSEGGDTSNPDVVEEELILDYNDSDGYLALNTSEKNGKDSSTILERLEIILEESAPGDTLSTIQYNMILLELVLSTLSTEEAIQNCVTVYRRMKDFDVPGIPTDGAPDASTYVIMMLALGKRAQAPSEAATVCSDMISSGVSLTDDAIVVGMHALEKKSRLKEADELMKRLMADDTRDVTLPPSAFLSLMHMFRSENMQAEAVSLVKSCCKELGDTNEYGVGKVATAAINWPVRDRQGKRIDCSDMLGAILDIFDPLPETNTHNERVHLKFAVWKRLIHRLSRENGTVSDALVKRAFLALRVTHDTFWPTPSLLKIGLRAANAVRDADLACDLVVRSYDAPYRDIASFKSSSSLDDQHVGSETESHDENQLLAQREGTGHESTDRASPNDARLIENIDLTLPGSEITFEGIETDTSVTTTASGDAIMPPNDQKAGTESASEVPNDPSSVHPPPQAFMAAMEICVGTGDMQSAHTLLSCIVDPGNHMPTPEKRRIFTLALKGHAKTADADSAEEILKDMNRLGANPGEEAYGAVIHSLAAARRTDEALALFQALSNGEHEGIAPRAACYDAALLAYLQAGAWGDALDLQEKRMESGLTMSPAGFQGSLIASFRIGQHAKAVKFVEEALKSKMGLDQACCELSMKILLKDILPHHSIDQTRKTLREMLDEDKSLQPAFLGLLRSLRVAEVEEKRHANNALTEEALSDRRQKAWRDALTNVLDLVRAADEQRDPTISSGLS